MVPSHPVGRSSISSEPSKLTAVTVGVPANMLNQVHGNVPTGGVRGS